MYKRISPHITLIGILLVLILFGCTYKKVMSVEEIAEYSNGVVYLEVQLAGKDQASGSGFFIAPDGILITNSHVIEGAVSVTVHLEDGTSYIDPIVLGYDTTLDIAVLQVNGTNLPFCDLGDSSTLKQGNSIIAIGSPEGLFNSLTTGVVSQIHENVIQISAPLNPGNSGGPLFDIYGKVVGITTFGITESEGLGFAIPIENFKSVDLEMPMTISEFYHAFVMNFYPDVPLFPVKVEKKWGYIDVNGNLVISPQFDKANPFYNGLALVQIGVDEQISFDQWMEGVRPTVKHSYIDPSGKYVIDPILGHELLYWGDFHEGLASFQDMETSFELGFINKFGQISIEPQFDNINWVNHFSEGYCRIEDNDKWGYIDVNGQWAIPPSYPDAANFNEGLAAVLVGEKDNKLVLGKYPDEQFRHFVADYEQNCKLGFINHLGEMVIEPQYYNWTPVSVYFSEGLAAVQFTPDEYEVDSQVVEAIKRGDTDYPKHEAKLVKKGLYGYIDKSGNTAISPRFDWAASFSEGLARVKQQGLLGYINQSGSYVIDPQYKFEQLGDYSEGLAAVKIDNRWGFIDKKGDIVIIPQFLDAENFNNGLARVMVDEEKELYAYINHSGEVVWTDKEFKFSLKRYFERVFMVLEQK